MSRAGFAEERDDQTEAVFEIAADGISYRMFLPDFATDYIQGELAWTHLPYELEMLRAMASMLEPGSIVVDAGANVGNHTIYLAAKARALVFAFEPNAHLAAAITRSAELNGKSDSITVIAKALGAAEGRGHFREELPDNLGGQAIDNDGDGEIAVTTLDNVAFPDRVAAIKIDVEGGELDVLRGATNLLTRDRPTIYVECADEQRFREVERLMRSAGYVVADQFNATPTFQYVPTESLTTAERLDRAIVRTIAERLSDLRASGETKRQLTEASLKYRASTLEVRNLRSELQLRDVEIAGLMERLSASEAEQGGHRTALEAAQVREARLSEGREQAERELERLAAEQEAVGARLVATQVELNDANLRLADEAEARSRLQAEFGKTVSELGELREAHSRTVAELGDLRKAYGRAEAQLADASAERGQLADDLRRAERARDAAVALADEVRDQHDALQRANKDLLDEYKFALDEHRESLSESARALRDARNARREMTITSAAVMRRCDDLERSLETERGRTRRISAQLLATQESARATSTALAQERARAERLAAELATESAQVIKAREREREASDRAERAAARAQSEALRADDATVRAGAASDERDEWRMAEAGLRAELERVRAQSRDVEARLSIATGRIGELIRQVREQTAEAEKARELVATVRSSITMRTGKLIRNAVEHPAAIFTLPAGLWRLQREQRARATRVIEQHPLALPSGACTAVVPDASALAPAPAPVAVARGGETAAVPKLRVAAIMDDFTRLSYDAEWDITDLTPDGWKMQLEAAAPELLFVESAWRGFEQSWHNLVSQAGDEIRGILAWCAEYGVPTVFWNKEDPVHFSTFLNVASLFDHVFTTDIDCIAQYKAALGHERVWLLPFAAQPAVHNPIADGERKDAIMFAGAYYQRYPERTRDLESFVDSLPSFAPIEIYDRNHGKPDEAYKFPDEYSGMIVGSLPPDQVHRAYKAYKYAINLNSVKQSQSMFARRAYELLASNAVTISNYSRGLRVVLGDLTICTDNGEEAVRRLCALRDGQHLDHLRLAGLRKVMREHTYANRSAEVIARVRGAQSEHRDSEVLVLAIAEDERAAERVIATLARQEYEAWRAIVVLPEGVRWTTADDRVRPMVLAELDGLLVHDVMGDAEALGFFVADDYYGPHYLTDLVLGMTYADADVFGKARTFRWDGERVVMNGGERQEYAQVSSVAVRRSIVRCTKVRSRSVRELMDTISTGVWDDLGVVSLDRFGYCEGAPIDFDGLEQLVDDPDVWTGTNIYDLYSMAAAIPAAAVVHDRPRFDARRLEEIFGAASRPDVSLEFSDDCLVVGSRLAGNVHDYVYAPRTFELAEVWPDRSGQVFFDLGVGLDVQLALIFHDDAGQRCGASVVCPNKNTTVEIPDGAVRIKCALRVRGAGRAQIRAVEWRYRRDVPAAIPSAGDTLVLTNIYPSYDSLYRNAFVHTRVKAYSANGVRADVACISQDARTEFREFEGIDVLLGDAETATTVLATGRYRSVLVHFLSAEAWQALKARPAGTKAVVWVHGAEIQPWWRRSFAFTSDEQLAKEKVRSEERQILWKEALLADDPDLHFVFVSRSFAEEALADLGVELESSRYSVIHNPIDTELFRYVEKSAADRMNVLSIRPYASRIYANDLAVAAVKALSTEPEFGEMHFTFIGDGPLFESTLEPIRSFPNVTVEQRFVTPREILDLHARNGLFLVPTRLDTQGVSRDEAMSSGLVPITNAVAAVPEFVDGESGVLVAGEDPEALAKGILDLVRNPDQFLRLSRGAASRVRAQSNGAVILRAELDLFAR